MLLGIWTKSERLPIVFAAHNPKVVGRRTVVAQSVAHSLPNVPKYPDADRISANHLKLRGPATDQSPREPAFNLLLWRFTPLPKRGTKLG